MGRPWGTPANGKLAQQAQANTSCATRPPPLPCEMPHFPAELLLAIFAQVRDAPDVPAFPHLGLLSCSLVSRFWYSCAFPLLLEANNPYLNRDINRYTNDELGRLAELMAEAKRYGLAHATLIEWVEIAVSKLVPRRFHIEYIDRRRAEVIGQLFNAMQPHLKVLKVNLLGVSTRTHMKHLQTLVFQLIPNLSYITTLHISSFSTTTKSRGVLRALKALTTSFSRPPPDPPSCPIHHLIHHFRPHLQHIHLTDVHLHPHVLRTLGTCTRLRTVRLRNVNTTATAEAFVTAVKGWPELRHLSVRHQLENWICLGPTITLLAQHPPPNLEVLDFDNSYCHETPFNPSFRSLLTACADTIIHLTIPVSTTEAPSLLASFITTLNMPNLRTLDMSLLGIMINTMIPSDEGPEIGLSWPRLRHLDVSSCIYLSPAFLRAVVASCPELEVVRVPYTYQYLDELQVLGRAGLVKQESRGEWAGKGEPWVRPGSHGGGIDGYIY